MNYRGPRRVHIAPQGFEVDRICIAASDANADKVILIKHTEQTEQGIKCHKEVVERLAEIEIEYDTKECDIFDIHDTLWAFSEVVESHIDDEIFVNIATGSKITAVAGVIVCMATGAHPYYVRAEEYVGKTTTKGVEGIDDVPVHPLGVPDDQYLEVLEFIDMHSVDSEYVSKGDVVEFVQDSEFPLLSKYNRQELKNMYSPVDKEILAPLRNHGFIKEYDIGQGKRIELTENGKESLEIYNYLLTRNR